VVLVTGASSGIGAATVEALAHAGARPVAVGRDEVALQRLADSTGAEPLAADVADPAHAARLVEATVRRHGRIDAVIANAGLGFAGDFATMPVERIEELVNVNVRAPMLVARAALPEFAVQRRGTLVFVSSIAGAVPVPGESAYSLSKHALEDFAAGLRVELHGSGVAVSVVRPGVVRTQFFTRRGVDYDRSFPRPIEPVTVADAIVGALRSGAPMTTVPQWLGLPAALRRRAPSVYRLLSRAFS
jgi:short-subunit dehydrogenase